MAKRMTFLENPARRSRRRKTARKAPRKARGVPAWVRARGFTTWRAYMDSIRKGGKGGTMAARKRRRRRRSVSRAAPRRRRRSRPVYRARRRTRRNPAGINARNITRVTVQAVQDGASVVVGQTAARMVRGRVLGMDGGSVPGMATEALIGVAGAVLLQRVGRDFARMFAAGAMSAPLSSVVRGLNIPFVSSALGDEGDFYLPGVGGSYRLGPGVGGYELSPDVAGTGDDLLVQ